MSALAGDVTWVRGATCLNSPVGKLLLLSSERGLARICHHHRGLYGKGPCRVVTENEEGLPVGWGHLLEKYPSDDITHEASQQLIAYFSHQSRYFDIPLDLGLGTVFQQQVWMALQKIRYGTVISYKQLAEWLGDTKKVRAVGTANGSNPLPIVIPCHRVIGSDGSLTGYALGLNCKRWLLSHEGTPGFVATQLLIFPD
jgi:methylated-DNA-[protein]-cysteine S-methyltransferase